VTISFHTGTGYSNETPTLVTLKYSLIDMENLELQYDQIQHLYKVNLHFIPNYYNDKNILNLGGIDSSVKLIFVDGYTLEMKASNQKFYLTRDCSFNKNVLYLFSESFNRILLVQGIHFVEKCPNQTTIVRFGQSMSNIDRDPNFPHSHYQQLENDPDADTYFEKQYVAFPCFYKKLCLDRDTIPGPLDIASSALTN